jgi:hypothetical protein
MDRARWKRLAGTCEDFDTCEGIYLTEQGKVAVQGGHLTEVRTPCGEAVVEISPELLREAARGLA